MDIRPLTTAQMPQILAFREMYPGAFSCEVNIRLTDKDYRKLLQAAFQAGQALGAFDAGVLVGIRVSILTKKDTLHTHLLGVAPAFRNQGVMRAMSLVGREQALLKGIGAIEGIMDIMNVELMGLVVNSLGLCARGWVNNDPAQCKVRWELNGRRAAAAADGRDIPYLSSSTVRIPVDHSRRHLIDLFRSQFNEGLAIVAFRAESDTLLYLMGEPE